MNLRLLLPRGLPVRRAAYEIPAWRASPREWHRGNLMDRDTFSALAVITAVAVIAPLLSDWTKNRIPDVVLEIGLGIIVGPYVLELAKVTSVVDALSFIGLAFLFFMA